jgi:hypothetical protein
MIRVVRSHLIITKPLRPKEIVPEVITRDVDLSVDDEAKTVRVKFIGETQLKGYLFEFLESEIVRARDFGEVTFG